MTKDYDPFTEEPPELVPIPLRTNDRLRVQNELIAEIRGIEERMLVRGLGIMDGVLSFADIDRDQEDPPQEWIDMLGEQEAKKRLRVARACWMNAKEAPVGLQLTQRFVSGAQKSRAMENVDRRPLQVTVVNIGAPVAAQEYPELEAENK